ncbi:MAG TPA: ABC transporter ATP-binding protein [Firmicutes bacterium]|nr:ABC transporter ATP-binding protein [Bacillota bacterium]
MAVSIEVCGLCFSYDAEEVLNGVNLKVEPGEFVGIVGPNGSGKSTLLKIMAALLRPSRGSIYINQATIKEFTRLQLARLVSMVGQDQQAGFNFQVKQVVYTGRYPYQERFRPLKESDRQAVERAMHLTGCYHLKDRDLFSLSGGEQQRVFLARALAQETPLLLLDEPTAFLDIGYQVELLELLQGLNIREKLTVIAIIHDLNLASRYCRKIFMLHQGKIFAWGSPQEVLTRDNILKVFRTEVLVEPHPLGNVPQIIPISTSSPSGKQKTCLAQKVHIIGGGGSATGVINQLHLEGVPLSAGVLSIGDSDWATARRLGIDMVEESPFSPIREGQHWKNLQLIEKSAAVVLAPLFLGHGNLLNVEAALHALRMGRPVIVMAGSSVSKRDFTGGAGEILYRRLAGEGAMFIDNVKPEIVLKFVQP